MADSYDVIVIGGGPGGYVAAIRSAQLGKKTAVVEKDKAGGRCLNYACIPAKTMLHTAEVLDHAQNGAELGVKVTKATLDWKALAERRAKVSEGLSNGVKMLWDKNKVTTIEGEGSLTDDANVAVGGETYEAGAVVLATGSVALPIPGVEFSERIVDTWGAWSLPGPAEAPGRGRRRRVGLGDRLRVRPLRHRGDADRDAAADPAARGQGLRPRGRPDLQAAGHHHRHGRPDRERRGHRQVGQVQGTATPRARPTTWRSPAAAGPTSRR